jgi:hypothetical protein
LEYWDGGIMNLKYLFFLPFIPIFHFSIIPYFYIRVHPRPIKSFVFKPLGI